MAGFTSSTSSCHHYPHVIEAVRSSFIWRPSLVADIPPFVNISRHNVRICVVDVSLLSEVLQPGGYWSSSGFISMYASNNQVKCDATFPY